MSSPPDFLPENDPFRLDCRGRMLDCRPNRFGGSGTAAHVMGILNVTPDSFSDGGRYARPEAALRRVEEMLAEGAAVIDIGGESTRPRGRTYGSGAEVVSLDEERARVLPIVEAVVRAFPEALFSIDTYKPALAREALEAGVAILNDVTGLRESDEMARVAAAFGAPLVVMHAVGPPGAMPHEQAGDRDVVRAVKDGLRASIRTAEAVGVRHLVTDPGFGFGKSPAENFRLIEGVDVLLDLGRPVLIGISRKSSIGVALGSPDDPVPIERRLFGSLGATAVGVLRGASIVRTHDVRPTVELLRVMGAVLAAREDQSEKMP